MRLFLIAVCVITGLVSTAFAYDTAECGEIEGQIYTLLDAEFGWEVTQSPVSQSAAFDRGCLVTMLDVYVEDLGATYRIGEAALVGEGLMDWVRGDVILPASLSLQLENIALLPVESLPEDLAWLADISANSIYLDARWTEANQTLRVAPLRIDFDGSNEVSVALRGQAVGWRPYDMAFEDFGLTDVSVDVGFDGLFEALIAPPIRANGTPLTPEGAQFMSAMAYGMLANVPTTLVPTASQEAIVDFLATIPNPRGDLSLSLSNDAPFFLNRIAEHVTGGQSLLEAVPDRLTLSADWRPAN